MLFSLILLSHCGRLRRQQEPSCHCQYCLSTLPPTRALTPSLLRSEWQALVPPRRPPGHREGAGTAPPNLNTDEPGLMPRPTPQRPLDSLEIQFQLLSYLEPSLELEISETSSWAFKTEARNLNPKAQAYSPERAPRAPTQSSCFHFGCKLTVLTFSWRQIQGTKS